MSSPHRGRVAVLLPSVELGTYWGPVLRCLDEASDGARIFTAQGWPKLEQDPVAELVTVVGRPRRLSRDTQAKAYGGGVMLLPLSVLRPLLAFRPATVAVMGFSLWTILVLALRPLLRWTVVLMWEGSSPGVDHRGSGWRTRLRRLLAGRADQLVTSNERSRRYLVDHLGVDDDRVDVHPLLVPSTDALTAGATEAPALAGLPRPVVLVVGRLEPRKGILPLLTALAPMTDVPWSLVVIGRGEQEPELKAAADRLGLTDRVSWPGWVDYGDLGAHIRAADVLAFPTLEDTWGMVAPESMALGTPVACSVHAGASEVITDGVDGVLVDPLAPAAMAATLRRMLTTADLAAMGTAAATTAARLTPASTAGALLDAAATARRRA